MEVERFSPGKSAVLAAVILGVAVGWTQAGLRMVRGRVNGQRR